MTKTGIKTSKEDFDKLLNLVQQGWQQGEIMIVFSVGEGIRKDEKTVDAVKACHQLALALSRLRSSKRGRFSFSP